MSDQRLFEVPQGSFVLERYPVPEPNLLAWNASDALALEWVSEIGADDDARCLVVNDRFGALAIGLLPRPVVSWNDSLLCELGTKKNLALNNLGADQVEFVASTTTPDGQFDLVVVQIPKDLGALEYQLQKLKPLLAPGAVVVGSGMTKSIHMSTIAHFERIIGPTKTSLAKRKARLIHPEPKSGTAGEGTAKPSEFSHGGLAIVSYPGVFSAGHLDRGTSLLLDRLAAESISGPVLDLGCGNGIVGVSILAKNPDAYVTFTDESYSAVKSAEESVSANSLDRATFLVDDCAASLPPNSFELVVINPPFHDRSARSTRTSHSMFTSAKRLLVDGGSTIVVGNRHLGYQNNLKSLFANCETLTANSKFSVLRSFR